MFFLEQPQSYFVDSGGGKGEQICTRNRKSIRRTIRLGIRREKCHEKSYDNATTLLAAQEWVIFIADADLQSKQMRFYANRFPFMVNAQFQCRRKQSRWEKESDNFFCAHFQQWAKNKSTQKRIIQHEQTNNCKESFPPSFCRSVKFLVACQGHPIEINVKEFGLQEKRSSVANI